MSQISFMLGDHLGTADTVSNLGLVSWTNQRLVDKKK